MIGFGFFWQDDAERRRQEERFDPLPPSLEHERGAYSDDEPGNAWRGPAYWGGDDDGSDGRRDDDWSGERDDDGSFSGWDNDWFGRRDDDVVMRPDDGTAGAGGADQDL